MLSKIDRAEVQTVVEGFNHGMWERYLVFYWDKNESGNVRENCFIFYDGPPNTDKLQEAKYIAAQLTK